MGTTLQQSRELSALHGFIESFIYDYIERRPMSRRLPLSVARGRVARELIDDDPHEIEQDLRLHGFILPAALRHLAVEIERSRSMLDLPDDWDEAGSPGYAEATWERAVGFLVRNASWLWRDYGVPIQAPRIRKGPDGSIDLDWRTPGHELLVNVPADPNESATYYGDDGAGRHQVKGSLDTSAPNQWLLMWLTE